MISPRVDCRASSNRRLPRAADRSKSRKLLRAVRHSKRNTCNPTAGREPQEAARGSNRPPRPAAEAATANYRGPWPAVETATTSRDHHTAGTVRVVDAAITAVAQTKT